MVRGIATVPAATLSAAWADLAAPITVDMARTTAIFVGVPVRVVLLIVRGVRWSREAKAAARRAQVLST